MGALGGEGRRPCTALTAPLCAQSKVKDLLWEADANGDGAIDLEDALALFQRVRQDRQGSEPYRMANLLEFLMHDTAGVGSVPLGTCLLLISKRFGESRSEVQAKLRQFFVEAQHDLSQQVSFREFERQIEYRRMLARS